MTHSFNPDYRELTERTLKLKEHQFYLIGDLGRMFPRPDGFPRIDRRATIGSIGSCFARHISNWLEGHSYSFCRFADGPESEHGSTRSGRVYSSACLAQEFQRISHFDGHHFKPPFHWKVKDDSGREHLVSPFRSRVAWSDEDEAMREQQDHGIAMYELSQCDVIIITVGQAEVWSESFEGRNYPLARVPPAQIFDQSRHTFRLQSFNEIRSDLFSVVNRCRGQVIFTVSPVPLIATFRDMPAAVADEEQKALIRAAVGSVCGISSRAHYFPAYEMIKRFFVDPYEIDGRHVMPSVVDEVMHQFERWTR